MDLGDVPTSIKLAWATVLAALVCACTPGVAGAAAPSAEIARLGAAPSGAQLQLVLPLVADEAGLERFARAVTTPGSPQYGRYESIARLSARFGAPAAVRTRVLGYLRRVGATQVKIDGTGLFADARLSAGRAQRLFSTPLARFSSAVSGRYVAPTSRVRIPSGLRGAVTGVVGLDTRPLVRASRLPRVSGADRMRAAARSHGGAPSHTDVQAHTAAQPSSVTAHTGTAAGCAAGQTAGEVDNDPRTDGFTPNQYLSAYGFDTLQNAGFRGQGERVALIEIDGFEANDIRTFAACFGLDIPAVQAFGVGTSRPLAPGGESTLDLEVLDAAAPDLAGIDVYETRPNAATTLRALTAPLQNRGHHPQVISASLGLCEPAVAAAVGLRGIRSTEAALAMAAANGVTVLASSGDSGSADCAGPGGLPLRHLAVNYPASSPWVTSVGGTNFQLDANNHIVGQIVWNDAGLPGISPGSAAGGGFSRLFHRPYYQNGATGSKSRVVPDVSMLADIVPGYAIFCTAAGECVNPSSPDAWQTVGGTSAGTPLLAGGLALVDQQLRTNNRADLGLVNPLIYQLGKSDQSVFSDVLAYGNDVGPYIGGSNRPLGCCTAGPGFDAASGWGSLNVGAVAPAAVLLQPPIIALRLPHKQHPLKKQHIVAVVLCAGACRIGAFANIRIGSHRAFVVSSPVRNLPAAGGKRLTMRFSKRELARLRTAVRRHQGVTATVYGVAVKGRRVIQERTTPARLRIK